MYEFEYQRPQQLAQAVAAAVGDEARYLGGGQSLVQSMRLRLASASTLVDLSAIPELRGIERSGDSLKIGAMTRHSEVARSADVRQAIPALADLAGEIGDQMVRNMGTIGGSIANADPAADYPAAVLGLGATVQTDRRSIAGDDFFVDLFTTALEPGELVVSVSFPIPQRAAYIKFKQPASRFALVGVMVSQGASGVRVAVTGVRSHAFRVPEMEQALAGNFSPDAIAGIRIDPAGCNSDLHGSAEYRAAMVTVMARRAVEKALAG
ncbi:MAG TPA: xanthine dehydrogenase family protein subunit M [Burkholderiaceae bacterium]|nr:xanthine dehydrogenase family protein subunit M [Burkholderiaceae bacterium]